MTKCMREIRGFVKLALVSGVKVERLFEVKMDLVINHCCKRCINF